MVSRVRHSVQPPPPKIAPREATFNLKKIAILGSLLITGVAIGIFSSWHASAPITERDRLVSSDPILSRVVKEAQPHDQVELRRLMQKINECPPAKQLWENINAKGPIALYQAGKHLVPSYGFWEVTTRMIVIDRTVTPFNLKLQKLLHEICNAERDLMPIALEATEGKLSQREYLKKIILYEYESEKCNYQLNKLCHETLGLNKAKVDLLAPLYENNRTPEAVVQEAMSDPQRKKYLNVNTENWVGLVTPYCVDNPKAVVCSIPELF